MKKSILLLASIFLIASAFATVYYGSSIYSYIGVTNPSELLDSDSGYARFYYMNFSNSSYCPVGDFSFNAPGCVEDDSGQKINSWAIVTFNNTVTNVTRVSVNAGNYNDGCSGSDCGKSAVVKVFSYEGNPSSMANWDYIGSVNIPYNQTVTEVFLYPVPSSTNIKSLVVARGNYADSRPDPRVYWVTVQD